MIKAQFAREKVRGFGLGLSVEFARIPARHPYRAITEHQPTFTMAGRFWKWQAYVMIYKPVKFGLNRAERRANHLH